MPDRAAARYFADTSMAVNYALHAEFPVAAYKVRHTSRPRGDENFNQFRSRLLAAISIAGLKCRSLVASIPASGLDDPRLIAVRADDPGRALMLGWLFRVMGVSPYLIFWMAPLLASAVLLWSAWELWRLGCPVAAAGFALFTALSAFVAETLALEYSAVGFYLVALLLAVPLSAYAASASWRTPAGVLIRAGAAGAVFGVALLARSASIFVAPVLVASVALSARGLYHDRPPVAVKVEGLRPEPLRLFALPRSFFLAALSATLLAVPYLALRMYARDLVARTSVTYGVEAPEQRHDLWLSVWEGLGDFDRTKGHVWLDESARQLAGDKLLMTPGTEKIFRRSVLSDIGEDPGWFMQILLQRAAATVLQRKLWPWGPMSGISVAPQTAINEGALDTYYSLVTPADWFGVGRARVELPVPLLIAFILLLAALTVRPRRRLGAGRRRAAFALLAALAASAAAMPVAVTTAGAIEPQAFVLVYLLAAAFALEAIVRPEAKRPAGASAPVSGSPVRRDAKGEPDAAVAMATPPRP